MRKFVLLYSALPALWATAAFAGILGQVRGTVSDPKHRPLPGAHIVLRAARSSFTAETEAGADGAFSLASVPLGDYTLTVSQSGFESSRMVLTLESGTAPTLHVKLQLPAVRQSMRVQSSVTEAGGTTATPTTLISRDDIARTPGADHTDSLAMITDYVPGAYVTHDQLHIRGGHQVSWLIDGVEIPNTNIASNLGAQIDPKDVDYLETKRGSYTADIGDRTYGVFNVVPRTGFESDREAELILGGGSFLQTNDQIHFGDHTSRFAYYASLNGNHSDYGLSTPIGGIFHDAANGYGGFASLVDNHSAKDQFRFVGQLRADYFQIPYDPDPDSFENQQFNSSGLRDGQHEADGFAVFSWIHALGASSVLQVSPFYHHNRADYQGSAEDTPVATTSDRGSDYAGAQISFTAETGRNSFQAGLSSFGQHDSYLFGAVFNDGSGTAPFSVPDQASGGVVEEYVAENYKVASWLTLIGGLRETHFQGQFTEDEIDPRVGAAVRVPKLHWVFRGFYGRFYQPPPLLTAAGPIVQFAQANNTTFQPLHGERDEEHQFGVRIPLRGWVLDADTFRTRANNFLDHSNIGDSSIYYPVTVDGALIRAWELTLSSPRLWRLGHAHLAYSNQIAEQRGNITGGLVCTPIGSPTCDSGFSYIPVDHDQRNTLNVGWNAALPFHIFASTNVYYGSGFTNGDPDPSTPYPNAYLPHNTSVDLSLNKSFGEAVTAGVGATNVANRRVLLDNSLTFGGFHFNDPRQIFGEVRYRFHY